MKLFVHRTQVLQNMGFGIITLKVKSTTHDNRDVAQEMDKIMETFFKHCVAHMPQWKVIHNMSLQQGEQ